MRSPLVTPEALAVELGLVRPEAGARPAEPTATAPAGGRPILLDLRPAEEFAAGCVPGATHLDLWAVSLNDTDPAPLRAFMWMIVHVLETRGVNDETPVVVYDAYSGLRAARAFWFLDYFGHPDARLLDGGFEAWVRAGLPVAQPGRAAPNRPSDATTGGAAGGAKRRWADGWPTPVVERLATWRDVRDRLGRPDVVLVDTRSDEEYYGVVVRARRGGAIPGAVHIEWTRNLDARGAFKPPSELRALYEAAGVTPDKEVITYCQGGYRAAHTYVALRSLGYPRVRNYLGSWQEWGDRDDLPIERPART
jgi:thiosulfate/3-mercaptopyruvate sulfurtransferase